MGGRSREVKLVQRTLDQMVSKRTASRDDVAKLGAALGLVVRKRRLQAHLTQTRLARRAGVAFATVNRLEMGRAEMVALGTLIRVAAALNCSCLDLLREAGIEETPGKRKRPPKLLP